MTNRQQDNGLPLRQKKTLTRGSAYVFDFNSNQFQNVPRSVILKR